MNLASLPSLSFLPAGTLAAAGAFAVGLGGSGHCALMCGPLACAGLGADPRHRARAAWCWQSGRAAAYAGVGAALGGAGHAAAWLLAGPIARALPWLMAAGLAVSALELGRRVPPLPGLGRIPRALARAGQRLSPGTRAALRGAATPFLPCGLLYGALLAALATGRATVGALVMIAFAAGAVPALAFVQINVARLQSHPRVLRVARRAIPLLAAAVLVWRALGSTGGAAAPHCH
jgi:sulfite exporter TauE/SafE